MNDWELGAYLLGFFIVGFLSARILKSLSKANRTLEDILGELTEVRHDRQMEWEKNYERESNSQDGPEDYRG